MNLYYFAVPEEPDLLDWFPSSGAAAIKAQDYFEHYGWDKDIAIYKVTGVKPNQSDILDLLNGDFPSHTKIELIRTARAPA